MHPLLSEFERVVSAQPTRPSVCDQSLMLDYRGLRSAAIGLSRHVAAATDRPHVGIVAPASAAGAAAIFACWYAGRVVVPLNFLLGPTELAAVVRDAGLDCALAVPTLSDGPRALGLRTLELTAATLAPGEAELPSADPQDIAAIIYTSGTAGMPKGVCLSFANLLHNARAAVEHARLTPDEVFLSVIPQFHSFGFTTMTLTPLLLGAPVWFLPRFSPLTVVNTIAERRVSIFMAVASMYGALARLKNAAAADLASLRLAISGGEPLRPGVARAFEARFGQRIMEGYGLTEASPVVSVNMPWAHRSGSVGRPLPGVEVYAVDSSGQRLGTDAPGELVVRGPSVMRGYHNRPDETAAAIRDGALHTGDLGRVDADGFIHVTGRVKEMIIVGGENVFPIEIENALCEHPAVVEAAVIGVPDEVRGELPVAYVVLQKGASATAADLRTFCRQRLAGYKVPREVRIVSDLPRGPTGKVLKRALTARPG